MGLLIGTMERGRWMGLEIPFSLTPLGAAGCTLNTDPALIAAAAASTSGEARVTGQLPRLPVLVGVWFRFQALALDPGANALGMALSAGSKTQICGPDPMARVVATSLLAVSGQLEPGVSPVTRFTFQ